MLQSNHATDLHRTPGTPQESQGPAAKRARTDEPTSTPVSAVEDVPISDAPIDGQGEANTDGVDAAPVLDDELHTWRELFAAAMNVEYDIVTPEAVHKEFLNLRKAQGKSQQEKQEQKKRESALLMRLSVKEQEIRELQTEVQDLRTSLQPRALQMRVTLLDPAVNAEFRRLKAEVRRLEDELKAKQDELDAVDFSVESNTGKQLLDKCKKLMKENQEYGQQLSEGKVHELESQLEMTRAHTKELKDEVLEMNEYLTTLLDQEDTLSCTITDKDTEIESLKAEIENLKQGRTQTAEREKDEHAEPMPAQTMPESEST